MDRSDGSGRGICFSCMMKDKMISNDIRYHIVGQIHLNNCLLCSVVVQTKHGAKTLFTFSVSFDFCAYNNGIRSFRTLHHW